jgi:hypothetical protein
VNDPQSQRSIYRGLTLFCIAASAIAWVVPIGGEMIWVLRTFPILGIFAFGWKWLSSPGAIDDAIPDVLGERFGRYYEREGLCFAPQLTVEDGECWFNMFCQNRSAKRCTGSIYFVPMEGLAKTGDHEVLPFYTDVEFEGGEVGVVSIPYPIRASWQGKIMVYDVAASVKYPHGRGAYVRAAQGIAVGEPTSELKEMLLTIGLLAFGKLRLSKGASCELNLPAGVSEIAADNQAMRTEVLWQMPANASSVAPD